MKKSTFSLLILFLIGITTSSQELTCADFRIGQFYIPDTKEMTKYTIVSKDSISEFTPERNSTIKKYIVIREENTQIEWKNGIGNGSPEYEIIEWIDDCTYRLTYDSAKSELDEGKRWINENNGIVVSKTRIENNCLYYTAIMTTKEDKKFRKTESSVRNKILCNIAHSKCGLST